MFFTGDIKDKKILLHACCGPCSLGAIPVLLADGADITVYYYNPCIVPVEYEKRLDALRFVCEHYCVPLVAAPPAYPEYLAYAAKYSSAPEGGERCGLCMDDRLRVSAVYAKEHGFDAYTTTLTVSPHKNSKRIFSLADAFDGGAPFLPRDFKKKNGFLLSCRLSEELGIYRQNFCGCEFSLPEARAQRSGA